MCNEITQGECNLVDWMVGRSGKFLDCLFAAISAADEKNMRKLEKGFQEEVEAFMNYLSVTGYRERLLHRYEINTG